MEKLNEKQLARAIELMVSAEDLRDKNVMIAILQACAFDLEDVLSQLSDNEVLHGNTEILWNY